MNLRDRLSHFTRLRATRPERDERYAFPETRPLSLGACIPGQEMTNEIGSCYWSRQLFPSDYRYGQDTLGALQPIDTRLLALLARDPAIATYEITDALFLDTETTALSGGTGTVAFLIGMGWFEADTFVLHQLFLRDYDEEKAALIQVHDFIRERKFLVTFNGKAFDINLLATRFILNRMPPVFEDMPHVDLLHPARRLVGHRLAERNLASLEQSILGVYREDDIPGSMIPSLYFHWLRWRDARLMDRIFAHNQRDILSLVSLASKLTQVLDPDRSVAEHDPSDKLAAGRLWASRGEIDQAIHCLDSLRTSLPVSTTRQLASRELSLIYRRLGKGEEAVAIWEEMLADDAADVFALVELAKWYEHQARAPEVALRYACRAFEICPHSPEIAHRIRRLKQRLGLPP